MAWTQRTWMTLAALAGFGAVGFGAFAAHGAPDARSAELLRTGALYEFMHAMATIACAVFIQLGARRARFSPAFFLAGIVLFSGSLYALAFGAPRWVGVITPIGGVSLMVGWGVLICASMGIDRIVPDSGA